MAYSKIGYDEDEVIRAIMNREQRSSWNRCLNPLYTSSPRSRFPERSSPGRRLL